MDTLISFDNLRAGQSALKKLAQAFTRAGSPVAGTDIDPRTRRTSGINYRQVMLTMTDSQTVTLGVKTTGDIFEVKVNGVVLPIVNQDNQVKAVGEITKALISGRQKFQAKMARQKVALPKGITTAAPRMEARLAEINQQVDAQIIDAKARVNELRAELGEPLLDSAGDFPRLEPDGKRYGRDQYRWVDTDEHGEMPASLVLKEGAVPVLDSAAAVVLDCVELQSSIGKPAHDEDGEVMGTVTAIREVGPYYAITLDGAREILARNAIDAGEFLDVIAPVGSRVLDSVKIPNINDLASSEQEVLEQIARAEGRKVFDGDLVSKSGRDGLVARGLVERVDGDNILTAKGQGTASVFMGPVAALPTMGTTWLGFKVMDLDAVMQAGPMALPSAHELSGVVRMTLEGGDGEDTSMLGVVVQVGFRSGKVVYSVAVPVAPSSKPGGRQIMVVIPDVPSELVASYKHGVLDGVGYAPELKHYATAVLDAVDVPINSFTDPSVIEAERLLVSINDGAVLDGADFTHALATLHIALDVVDTNYPINLAEGDLAQAELEERAGTSYRAAIAALQALQAPAAAAA